MSLPLRSIKKINSVKETLAKQAEWSYADAMRKQIAAESVLQQMQTKFERSLEDFQNRQLSGLSVSELRSWTEWHESQRRRIQKQLTECRQLSESATVCRNVLVERRQDKEIWKRLQEKRVEGLHHEMLKREQSELDEMGMRGRQRTT